MTEEIRVYPQIRSLPARISRVPETGTPPTLSIRVAAQEDLIECMYWIDERPEALDVYDTMCIWILLMRWSQYWASVDSRFHGGDLTPDEERVIEKTKRVIGYDLGVGFREVS